MPGLIRLEWQRDPNGYAFYEFSPEALDLIELMMWSEPEQGRLAAAEGQQLRADEAASTERVWLVSTSRKLEPYSVEGTDKKICLQLANTPCTPGGAQKFVNEWGTIPLNGRQQAIQDVHEIYKCIRGMRRAAALLVGCEPMSAIERLGHSAPWMMAGFRNAWSEVERGPSVPLQLRIRRLGTASTPRLTLDASDLLSFCFAEVMQIVGTGTEIRKCLRCGTLFALGKVGQRATYCSDKCRVAMHRKRKAALTSRKARKVLEETRRVAEKRVEERINAALGEEGVNTLSQLGQHDVPPENGTAGDVMTPRRLVRPSTTRRPTKW